MLIRLTKSIDGLPVLVYLPNVQCISEQTDGSIVHFTDGSTVMPIREKADDIEPKMYDGIVSAAKRMGDEMQQR